MSADRVSVEPLREAFLRSGLTLSELARRCGWVHNGKADVSGTARRLGLEPQRIRGGLGRKTELIDYERAVAVVKALDVDPVDVGV